MNRSCLRLLSAVALATAAVQSAHAADDKESPWSLSVFGGSAFGATGSVRKPEITAIPDLGNLDPGLAESSGSVSMSNVTYDDIYDHRHDIGLELGYNFSPSVEGFGRVTYEGFAGRTTAIGSLSSDALPAPQPLMANFEDADSWSFELGSRYAWPTSSAWKPFADIALGATRMDALTASLEVPGTAINLPDVRFTRSGAVFTQSVGGGIEYEPNRNFGLLFAANAEHTGSPPQSHDEDLRALGLDTTQNAEGSWSFPITVTASYRFGRSG